MIEVAYNIETDVHWFMDQHVLTAIICTVAATMIAGGLIIWHAIEVEMRRKK